MTQKRHRAGAQVAEIDGAVPPALHRWHPRSVETTSGQPHYAENCRLLDDYRAYSNAEFTRPCEVLRRLMGHVNKYRPED